MVTWTQTAEWCVEAENAPEVEDAAEKVFTGDLDFSDVTVDTWRLPDDAGNELDAVVIDGELLYPEDAAIRHDDLVDAVVARHARLTCPVCDHEDWTGEFHRAGELRCPACRHEVADEALRAMVELPRDDRTLSLFEVPS